MFGPRGRELECDSGGDGSLKQEGVQGWCKRRDSCEPHKERNSYGDYPEDEAENETG